MLGVTLEYENPHAATSSAGLQDIEPVLFSSEPNWSTVFTCLRRLPNNAETAVVLEVM